MSNNHGTRRFSQVVNGLLERFGSPGQATHFPGATQTSTLLALPDDILLLVLALIDPDDLLICKQVCMSLSRLVQHDVRSQYRIELAVTGMVDGPPSDITLTDRLEQLREHRARSHSSHFSRDESIWFEVDARVQVLTSDGTILYAMRRPGGYKLDVRTPLRVQAALSLCSYCLSIEAGQESHIEAMDMSQNLLIISEATSDTWEVTASFLNITSGEGHADAAGPIIRTVSEQGRPLLVQIHQQYVAWLVWIPASQRREVEVWDWHTSRLVWRRAFRPQVSFTFLDTSHILVTSGRQEVLEVFCLDGPAYVLGEIIEPFLTLELPLGAFRCSVHHDERSRIHSSSPPPDAPFIPDPMLSVVAVRFAIYATDLSNALLLVPGSTFRAQIQAARGSDESHHRVFWHEWGPKGGLLLNLSGPEVIPRAVFSPCGSRFPMLIRDKWRAGSAQIVIFDLNPWAARAAQSNPKSSGSLTVMKDASSFRFRTLRASIPHVAYQGPRLSFPKEHKPTYVNMNHDGFTVLHEWKPPYQERLGFGYQTFFV
ncbi:hypothetical protein DICSQDRAFT_154348 [Dichomitus squalens LYAD-421 SS1]|uniref:uncharacterized protein n=1 Tax=Dichomitus squalens (strain LYAD-421) TaxID=732165 RepID=UPI0004414E47|nr:uncharacterized protein DICSQDRAFT_154348 [Dichomitus squalens LYAD-421 SS1]EJF62458.1 hypothetical protein DICSQDRAFT_154348 [Dichomitus squalens LYAD-421 SS1]